MKLSRLALILSLALAPSLSWSLDKAAGNPWASDSTTTSTTETERDPLLISATTSPTDWNTDQAGQLRIELKLPEGFHAYEDQFKLTLLEPDGFHLGPWKLSPVVEFFDKFSKKNRRGMKTSAVLTAGIQAPARFAKAHPRMRLELVYQACSDSFCLFPITRTVDIPVTLLGAPEAPPPPTAMPVAISEGTSLSDFFSGESLGRLLGENLPLALLFVFLAGVLTSFTPCIFPMIPITLAILGHESEKRSRAQNFLLSVFYVHGIATTYSVLGVIAASSGSLFGASLGNPWVLSVICAVFFVMALGMYGLFELQVPAFIRNRLGAKKTKTGFLGAYVSGMIAGVVASPCVGPVLVAILAWVATTQNKGLGFILLFTYAIGLGLIFLILGAFTELTRKLPRSGPWLDAVKFVLGSLMLGAFYYYLGLLIAERWHDGALGIGLITLGSLGGAFAALKGPHLFARLRKGFTQALLVIGIGYLALSVFNLRPVLYGALLDPSLGKQSTAGAAVWMPYSENALEEARRAGKPVIIDFWAEWCAACHELEQHTFRDRRVQLTFERFTLLRYDATKDSAQLRDLKKRWKIQGLPTVIFVNPSGTWLEGLTLTEFERPEKFLGRMEKALN